MEDDDEDYADADGLEMDPANIADADHLYSRPGQLSEAYVTNIVNHCKLCITH